MSLASKVDMWKRALNRGVFPHEFSWVLELPWRRLLLSPQLLASRLPLRPDASVLELGPGGGYYSVEVAKHIPAGRPDFTSLVSLRRRAERFGFTLEHRYGSRFAYTANFRAG